MSPILHIQLLGNFRLMWGETPVTTITIPRVQSLLAYLVLHHDVPQDRSHLAFLFWPDSTEAQAHTNLRQLVHHLRRSLPNADQFISSEKRHLRWQPSTEETPWTLDVLELKQTLAQGDKAQSTQDINTLRQTLERVLHLYSGDLLPNCYEEWILPERDHWHQMFLQAAERLITLLEEDRAYDDAIIAAQRLLRQDALHEATYRQLMRLHALRGDKVAALRVYHTCAKLLERELQMAPSAMTQAVYVSIRQSNDSAKKRNDLLTKQRTEAPLQGRQTEWKLLKQAWLKATGGLSGDVNGKPHLVLITGEAGIGKTRLAQELEVWISRQGMVTASARCYQTLEHLAYTPVIAWLRSEGLQACLPTLDLTTLIEIARLVPEILDTHPQASPPAAMNEGWQRQFFFAALTRALLSARQPLLLLLDDLQWCDQETLEWLHYLFHSRPKARILLVATMRVEDISRSHPLMALMTALQRDELATEITLGPLTLKETTTLAESILGDPLDLTESNRLYQETEGNPFFVVELIRAGKMDTGKNDDSPVWRSRALLTYVASPLPPAVQAVLATRLAPLSAQGQAIANVAAVIGREFAFSVLAHASGESEEHVVQGLDELWQRRIIREQDRGATSAYDFSHDKIREFIADALSPAQRRFLHQRVAQALQVVSSEEQEAIYGQIAAHYEQAGIPDQAILWYQQAGKAASRIYAQAEALHAFKHASALLETHQPGRTSRHPWETAIQVYLSLGDVYAVMGTFEEARQAYQRAMTYLSDAASSAAASSAEAPLWQAHLHWKIATTWEYASTQQHASFHDNARQAFGEAEHLLLQWANPENPAWRDEWIALQLAQLWQGRGSLDEMATAIEKARSIVEPHGTPEQHKRFEEAVSIYTAIRDRYVISPERIAVWRENMAARPATNEAQREIELALLGIGLFGADQFNEAEEYLRQALRMGENSGNAWLQYNCLTFLPLILRRRGQVEEMEIILEQAHAVGVANRILIGHMAWVAWRKGELTLAEILGQAALQEEHTPQARPNPFLWTGRWPLIGVAMKKEQTAVAIDEVRLLFDATQQPLPASLDALLQAVVRAWDAGAEEQAYVLLQQALPLATQLGYL